MKYDCLLIGHNDTNITSLYAQLKAMGEHHADFRDLDINVINHEDEIFTVMDAVNYYRYDKSDPNYESFNNGDLLWNTILYLGSFLNKEGLSFDYINLFQREKDKLRSKLENNEYSTIAITTTVYTMVEPVIEVIDFVKQSNQTAKIIVGGPLVNKQTGVMEPDEKQLFYKLISADIYVDEREGEKALAEAVKAVKLGTPLGDVPNIVYRSNNSYIINEKITESNLLEDNPIDYSLFDPKDFRGSMNIRISKGCPYNCSFCGFPKRSNKYRYLDVDKIIADLDNINQYHIKNLFFLDDSVNVPKAHFKELLEQMTKKDYEFVWNCFFRCDQCDEEMIELMKQAKCEGVFLGLESTSEEILKNMNKTNRKENFERTIPMFHERDINVFVSIFTGFPGETFETFRNTIDFIHEMKPDFYRPQVWYCDPVTPIFQKGPEFGLVGSNFSWKHNTMSVSEACDLNEWAFFYLNDTIWAPDPGFNFISIYYMKLRGYSMQQIRDLLVCFNNVIKMKIMRIANSNLISVAYTNLCYAVNQEAEKFDQNFMNRFSGNSYQATERYIKDEFKWDEICYATIPVEEKSCKEIVRECAGDVDLYDQICIAATKILSKVSEKEAIHVCCQTEDGVVPMKFVSNDTIEEQLKEKLTKASAYGTFGLHILTHNKKYLNHEFELDLLVAKDDFEHEYESGTYHFDLSVIYHKEEQKICIKYLTSNVTASYAEQFSDILFEMLNDPNYDLTASKQLGSLKKADIFNQMKDFDF